MSYFFEYGERETGWLASRDEGMARAIGAIGHIERRVRDDVFSSLVSSIVGQQISTKAARTVWGRFVERLGEVTPRGLAELGEAGIQGLGVSFRKAGYIANAARAALSGELDVDAIAKMPDDEAIRALSSLDGIGVWTAEMLLLFTLRRPDVLSYGDLGIHRGMIGLYGTECADASGKRAARDFFEAKRRAYSPYGSVASLYLWAVAGGADIKKTGADAPARVARLTRR